MQGWHVSAEEADPDAPDAALGRVYEVQMRRSLGVVLFGIAIVLVLVALPFLALWVVINVYRGRRKFEPAFLSWIAAMLFATIPIRNFLPGSPPAGSWVDVAVVIWVIIALDRRAVLRSRLLVAVQSRQRPAGTDEQADGAARAGDHRDNDADQRVRRR